MQINFKILDGIRGVSALYVVINHCRGNLLMGGSDYAQIVPIADWEISAKIYFSLLQLTSLGREFVVVFFVLSGFSIAHSLRSDPSVLQFYKKRLIRLYLPFAIALLFSHVVFVVTSDTLNLDGNPVFYDLKTTLLNFMYIPTGEMIPQFWSLSYEVLFYLIAPLIFIAKGGKNVYFIVSILLYLFSVSQSVFNLGGYSILTKFILDYNIFFAVGIFLYSHYDSIKMAKIFLKKYWLFIITLICIPLMIVIKYKMGEFNKLSSLISAFYSIILIVFFLEFRIQNTVIKFLGKISYTLYITHFAALYLFSYVLIEGGVIDRQVSQDPFVWIYAVVICVVVAYPFYLIGEYPTKRLLARMRSLRKAK